VEGPFKRGTTETQYTNVGLWIYVNSMIYIENNHRPVSVILTKVTNYILHIQNKN